MLSRFPLNPVLPARNGDRARAFYRDVLGLTLVSGPHDDPMMFTAAEGTRVAEIVEELLRRGVSFRDPGAERGSFAGQAGRAEGVITDYGPVRSTWFHDSEGNVLALNEIVG